MGDVLGVFVVFGAMYLAMTMPEPQQYTLIRTATLTSLAVALGYFLLVSAGLLEAKRPAIHPFAFAATVAFALAAERRRESLAWMAAVLLIFYINLFESQSRGGVLGLVVVGLAAALLMRSFRLLLLIAVVAVLTWNMAPEDYGIRKIFEMTFADSEQGLDQSSAGRIYEIEMQMARFREDGNVATYMTGFGPGAEYPDLLGISEKEKLHHAHITPVFLYFKFGLIGLIAYVMLTLWLWWRTFYWLMKVRVRNQLSGKDLKLYMATLLGLLAYTFQTGLVGQEFLANPLVGVLIGVGVSQIRKLSNMARRPVQGRTSRVKGDSFVFI
jgi:O-antigen ligase